MALTYNPALGQASEELEIAPMEEDEEEEEALLSLREIMTTQKQLQSPTAASGSANNVYLDMYIPSVDNILAAIASTNPDGNLVQPFMDLPENKEIFGAESWDLIKSLTAKFKGAKIGEKSV